MRAICALIAATALIVLAGPAGTASANGFTLKISAPSTPVVGQPMILQVTGTLPPDNNDEIRLPYWFSLSALSTSVTTTCPSDHFVAAQLANSTGGSIVVLSQLETPDAAGNFSLPVGITPTRPGSVLLCGYTDDGEAMTMTGASLVLHIRPAPKGSGGARIAADTAAAVRSCRALLDDPTRCVRRAVARGNARCRRLPSRRSQTACLRAVRRIGRSS